MKLTYILTRLKELDFYDIGFKRPTDHESWFISQYDDYIRPLGQENTVLPPTLDNLTCDDWKLDIREIKCPKCGNKNVKIIVSIGEYHYCECPNCNYQGEEDYYEDFAILEYIIDKK